MTGMATCTVACGNNYEQYTKVHFNYISGTACRSGSKSNYQDEHAAL